MPAWSPNTGSSAGPDFPSKSISRLSSAIANNRESTIARESDVILPTLAGPEIGVASTKAFTCQLTVLACMAIAAGRARGQIGRVLESELVEALSGLPRHMATIL